MGKKITACDIKKALAVRHSEDFFQTEVKDGPTWGRDHLRMDALAIKKSWFKPCITAYEIKVSRSDFNNDTKWHNYLPLCHRLYFAVPKGLVSKSEIASPAGLIVYNDKGEMRVVKAAKHRPVEPDANMLMYLIMNGARTDRYPFHESKKKFYEDLVAYRDLDIGIGAHIPYFLRRKLADINVEKHKIENAKERIEKDRQSYTMLENWLKKRKLLRTWRNKPEELINALQDILDGQAKNDLTGYLEKIENEIKCIRKSLGIVEK